jgi:hypothetical protein
MAGIVIAPFAAGMIVVLATLAGALVQWAPTAQEYGPVLNTALYITLVIGYPAMCFLIGPAALVLRHFRRESLAAYAATGWGLGMVFGGIFLSLMVSSLPVYADIFSVTFALGACCSGIAILFWLIARRPLLAPNPNSEPNIP